MVAGPPPSPAETAVLPMQAAAERLRAQALARLPSTVRPAWIPDDRDAAEWLDGWIADDPHYEQRLLRTLLVRRLFGAKTSPDSVPADMVTARAARAVLLGVDWRRLAAHFPPLRKFIPPPRRYVPDAGWRMAGDIAWADGRFLLALALEMRRRLRATGPFPDTLPSALAPAPETFWLLCAAVPDRWTGKSTPASFRDLALRLTGRLGWAGAWEQWLIAESVLASGKMPPAPVQRTLAQLPVFDLEPYAELRAHLGQPTPDGPAIAAVDWNAALPPCLAARMRAAPTPRKKASPHV